MVRVSIQHKMMVYETVRYIIEWQSWIFFIIKEIERIHKVSNQSHNDLGVGGKQLTKPTLLNVL